jgi:hypothetical protein
MIWNRHHTNSVDWRKVLAAVLLIAAMLRGLMPTGFMPAIAADGSFEIVICSSSGLKTISVTPGGEPVPSAAQQSDRQNSDGSSVQQPCVFGGLADAVSLGLPLIPIRHASLGTDVGSADIAFLLPPYSGGPPLGAQAPPHF